MSYRNKADRRRGLPPFPTLEPTIGFTVANPSASVLRLTFDAPVQAAAIPEVFLWTGEGTAGPARTTFSQTSSTVIDVTFASTIATVTYVVAIRENSENVRGVTGGFVSAAPRFLLVV